MQKETGNQIWCCNYHDLCDNNNIILNAHHKDMNKSMLVYSYFKFEIYISKQNKLDMHVSTYLNSQNIMLNDQTNI